MRSIKDFMAFVCTFCQKILGIENDHLRALEGEPAANSSQDTDRNDSSHKSMSTTHDSSESVHDPPLVVELSEAKESNVSSNKLCTTTTTEQGSGTITPDPKRVKLSVSPSLESSPPTDRPTSVLCSACLGLLDKSFIEQLTESIVEELKRENYIGIETFSLALHVPLSLMIRRTGIKVITKIEISALLEHYVKEELREMVKISLVKKLSPIVFHVESPFQIILKFDHETSLLECKSLRKTVPNAFPKPNRRWRKSRNLSSFTNTTISSALEQLTAEDYLKHPALLSSVHKQCTYAVSFLHKPIYVGGRYNKYSRKLPQTPWVVDGVKKAETSVQELICPPIVSLVRADDHKFSSSGREDVDVRMLGDGRPFMIELINPRKVELSRDELKEVEESINSSTDLVAAHRLTQVTKEDMKMIKEGEEEKRKHYCALIWSEKEITSDDLKTLSELKDLKLAQKTPIRVLHRRALATRVRTVYYMSTEFLDCHHFKLFLCTQAGTYIKEFVHGDFGRTKPSLGTLLQREVDILTLDVENVQLEWPPK